MFSKTRLVLTASFLIVLLWDLFLKISGDLKFMGGATDYSYVGDLRVPGSLLVFVWILQVVIMYMGTFAILKLDLKKLIPERLKIKSKLILKFQCCNCGDKFPEFGTSINLKTETLTKFCPNCGIDQNKETIKITSLSPFKYESPITENLKGDQ